MLESAEVEIEVAETKKDKLIKLLGSSKSAGSFRLGREFEAGTKVPSGFIELSFRKYQNQWNRKKN